MERSNPNMNITRSTEGALLTHANNVFAFSSIKGPLYINYVMKQGGLTNRIQDQKGICSFV